MRGRMPTKADIVEFLAREFPHSQCVFEAAGDPSATGVHPVGTGPLAVPTHLNAHLLRKPSPQNPIVGVCRLIKVGRILVVGEVALYSERNDEMVAHAVGTYSIPPKRE